MDWRKNLDPTGLKAAPGQRQISPEAIFEEWRPVLEREARQRRRSVEEMEEDEAVVIASPFKKIKQDCMDKKRASEKTMAYRWHFKSTFVRPGIKYFIQEKNQCISFFLVTNKV